MDKPQPKVNKGNFAYNRERASAAGKLGGPLSPANFKHNTERARASGRKGGLAPRKKREKQ